MDTLFDAQNISAYLYCDDYQGGRMAAEHLIRCGCKNIVCIKGDQRIFSAKSRYRGYRDVCAEHGIPEQTVNCDYDFDTGLAMTEELLKTYPEVDGIMACNDIVAISTYKILHKRKIPVPDQIQIVGFDDIHLCTLMSPELTTISQPIQAIADKAIELIIDKSQGKASEADGARYVFPVSLTERETTRRKEADS